MVLVGEVAEQLVAFLALLHTFGLLLGLKMKKTSQELRMLSSVTINCQVTKIVTKPGSQLSVL